MRMVQGGRADRTAGAPGVRSEWPASGTLVYGLLAIAVGGCGPGQPPLHPASGRVVFQGRPAVGFTVAFSSEAEGTKGVEATGRIAADGRFTLETRQAGRQMRGAVAGPHRVVVLPPAAFGAEGTPIEPVPLRYADYSQSGLTAQVEPAGPSEFLFELAP